MKKLDIKLLEKGRLTNVLSEKVYDSENETLGVVIDYSNTEYDSWDKRCDIVVANGQKSTKLSDTFSLGREYLVQGLLQLQPIAFSGDNVVKFPITSIAVNKSLNVLENDTTVTLSIAQEMLDDIELFKTDVNGELVAQNIKIDGLVLDTDTRLSEQDIRLGQQDTAITTNRTDILAEVDRRTTLQDGVIDMWDDKITELQESRLILKNEIVNGDFSDGTNGWILIGLTMAGNTLTSTGLTTYPRIYQNTSNKTVLGDKLYVKFKGKALTQLYHFHVAYRGTTSTTGYKSMGTPKNYEMNEDIDITAISTLGDTEQTHIQVTIAFTQANQETNFSFNIESWSLINLTQIFGAGNEPTKEQMDELMKVVPNGWWDGELTLEQKEVVQWLLKLESEKANKQQEAWITPTLLNGWTTRLPSTPVRFRKNEFGRVEIEGAIKGGTLGVPAFVLPTGYQNGILYPKVFGVINYAGTMAEVSISGSKFTIDKSSSTVWISLEGISYEPN